MPLIHVYAYKCNMIILKQLLIYNCIPKEYLKRKYIFLLSQRFYLNDNNKYLLFNNCSFYLYVFILSFTATIVLFFHQILKSQWTVYRILISTL